MRHLAPSLAALLASLATGCGSGGAAVPSVHSAPLPVLSAQALPGMSSRDRALTPALLSHDAGIRDLPGRLAQWGFVSGTQREFLGHTPVFADVVSRTFRFGSASGAQSYVRMVGTSADRYYGKGAEVRPVRSGARRGYLITALPCGCHRETPLLLYIASRGDRVTWLQVSGPGVTPTRALQLAVDAP